MTFNSAFSDSDRGSALALLERPRVLDAPAYQEPVATAVQSVDQSPVATTASSPDDGQQWEALDRLLDNWQDDVLTKEGVEPSVKNTRQKPMTDAQLDRVLAPDEQTDITRYAQPKRVLAPQAKKIEVKNDPKAKTLLSGATTKTIHSSANSVNLGRGGLKPPKGMEGFLRLLRARICDNDRYPGSVKKRAISMDQQVCCSTCGSYIAVERLVNESYCCQECATHYNTCAVCARPFEVEAKGQQVCRDAMCRVRYVRRIGLRGPEYVLVKE